MKRTTPLARALAPLTLAALVLTACSGSSESSSSTTAAVAPRVVVTSVKDDPTSELLAAVYARVLEDAGFRVARKDPVALDQAGYYEAIKNGDFQLIPEFSGDLLHYVYSLPDAPVAPTTVVPGGPASTEAPVTIPPTSTVASLTNTTAVTDTTIDATATTEATTTTLAPSTTAAGSTTTVLPLENTGRSITEQLVAIRAALDPSLEVSNGLYAESKLVIACTAETLKTNETYQLITLTNLASIAPSVRLAGSAEFMADQEGGLGALQTFYGGDFKELVTVEDADIAAAVDEGTADCFAVNSLDPVITNKGLTVMVDDKVMEPSNAAIALISKSVATPDLVAALDTLATELTIERLNQMLNEVLTNGTDPSVVANAFMDSL